jgi:nitrilase
MRLDAFNDIWPQTDQWAMARRWSKFSKTHEFENLILSQFEGAFMDRTFLVAAAHASSHLLDASATVDKACALIADAGRLGVRMLVFPEVFIPGFPYWINCYPPLIQLGILRKYHDQSIEADGPELARLCEAAKRAKVLVAMGMSERQSGGRTCYNSVAFIDADGSVLGIHRKLQPTYAERYVWGQGDGSTLNVWRSSLGRVGGLACWEHTMNLARQALIAQGIELHAACWPGLSTMRGFETMFDLQVEALMRTHALTAGCFVIVAEGPLTQENIDVMHKELGPQEFLQAGGGWSGLIHPWATDIVPPHRGLEERLLVAEINLDHTKDVKVMLDGAGHYSRSDIVHMVLDRQPKRPLAFVPPYPEADPSPTNDDMHD